MKKGLLLILAVCVMLGCGMPAGTAARTNAKTDSGPDPAWLVADGPELVLPARTVAVVGHEYNMYLENVVLGYTERYYVTVKMKPLIVNAHLLSDTLRVTPAAEDIGKHTVTVFLKDEVTGQTVDEKVMELEVIADRAVTGSVIFIGDSLTSAGLFPAEIQYNLSGGGLVSLGTRDLQVVIGTQFCEVSVEGRKGWSANDYVTQDSRNGLENPFWDGKKFNFSYYMKQQGYRHVDVVCIGLGTNGGDTDETYNGIREMVKSIRKYDRDVIILVGLTPPPADQDGCGNNNGLQSSQELKRRFLNVDRRLIELFENTKDPNLDIVELYFHLDTKHDFEVVAQAYSARNPGTVLRQNENVHPALYGHLHFADAYYNRILYHLAGRE